MTFADLSYLSPHGSFLSLKKLKLIFDNCFDIKMNIIQDRLKIKMFSLTLKIRFCSSDFKRN